MSLEMALVWKLRLGVSEVVRGRGTTAKLLWLSSVSVSGRLTTTADSDRLNSVEVLLIKEGVEMNLAQVYIFRGWRAAAGELQLQKQQCKCFSCSSKDSCISRYSGKLKWLRKQWLTSSLRDGTRTLKSELPPHSFQDFLIIKWLLLVWTRSHLVPALRHVISFHSLMSWGCRWIFPASFAQVSPQSLTEKELFSSFHFLDLKMFPFKTLRVIPWQSSS